MKALKRIFCFALVFALLVSALPMGAAAADSAAVCMEYYDIIKESFTFTRRTDKLDPGKYYLLEIVNFDS